MCASVCVSSQYIEFMWQPTSNRVFKLFFQFVQGLFQVESGGWWISCANSSPVTRITQIVSQYMSLLDYHDRRWRGRWCRSHWPHWIFSTRDNVPTFLDSTGLDIFKETAGQFPAMLVASKNWQFLEESQAICNRYFEPRHNVLLNLTKWLSRRNLTRSSTKTFKIAPKEM